MENNRFEDSFRNAFDGAEISPSEGAWTNVELSLEKTLGGKMKRNLLLFQLLAAASVVFACGIGALYYLNTQPVNTNGISKEVLRKQDGLILTQKEKDGVSEQQRQGTLNKEVSSNKSADQRSIENQLAKEDSDNRLITRKAFVGDQLLKITDNTKAIESSNAIKPSGTYQIKKRELLSLARNATPVLVLPRPAKQSEPDAFMVMMARLKDEEEKYHDENKSSENMWASLGFGAGNYKPNMQAQNNNSSVTGESYSAGLHVAGKISKRIVLQGGVSYLSQNADFTSTTPVQGMATLMEYKANSNGILSNDVGIGRTPYTVNSSMQFVSIPFQAGYLIVDRAFGFQLNGGIATDLFINNTLSAENDSHQKVTQAAGKDSPYRTVNFSGLLGTEFSYRLADHYRISLNPGLRYSLNSIYKEEIAVTITPVTFDVSLRFRYIFK